MLPPISASPEDKREAVNMGVSLSVQLQTAAFSLIGIVGGFITFMLENDSMWCVYAFFLLGIGFCIASIYQGSIGTTVARNNGFRGDWKIDVTKKYFNRQAIYLLSGAMFLMVAILFLRKDEDLILRESKTANELLKKNLTMLDSMAHVGRQYEGRIFLLERRLDSLGKCNQSSKQRH